MKKKEPSSSQKKLNKVITHAQIVCRLNKVTHKKKPLALSHRTAIELFCHFIYLKRDKMSTGFSYRGRSGLTVKKKLFKLSCDHLLNEKTKNKTHTQKSE
jgi:hypothetical protein